MNDMIDNRSRSAGAKHMRIQKHQYLFCGHMTICMVNIPQF